MILRIIVEKLILFLDPSELKAEIIHHPHPEKKTNPKLIKNPTSQPTKKKILKN